MRSFLELMQASMWAGFGILLTSNGFPSMSSKLHKLFRKMSSGPPEKAGVVETDLMAWWRDVMCFSFMSLLP